MITIPSSAAPDVQQAFRQAQAQLSVIVGAGNWDLKGRRLINAGQAISPADYTTLNDVQRLVAAATPIAVNVTGTAQRGLVHFGTHAQRLTAAPIQYLNGPLWFETDRVAIYGVTATGGIPAWALMAGAQAGTAAGRPGDLGTNEEGFVFYAQDQGVIYYWSGAVWHYECGTITDVFANRPAAGGSNIAGGVRFAASDRGYQEWVYDLVNLRWQFAGGGYATRGTLANLTSGLGAQDVGYTYDATDYDRTYIWTGAAYADAPGQPARGQIVFFPSTYGGVLVGWHLCDGTNPVAISTAVGGVVNIAVPDLITANRFLRSVTGTTGGTGGSATTHTHQVDPPPTAVTGTSANDSGTQTVQSGAGATVPAEPHTHAPGTFSVDVAPFASAVPSGVGGNDALPPYYNANPYIRL